MDGSTMPLPTVVATFRWKMNTATKLNAAANATAVDGRSTPVETMVAIELAASCRPFMKSNATARTTSPTSTAREISTPVIVPRARGACSKKPSLVLQRDALGQVGHVEAAVGDRLEQLVDRLHLDDLAHV